MPFNEEDEGVYCARSHICKKYTCEKHLNGFWALYLKLKEYDCKENKEEINES